MLHRIALLTARLLAAEVAALILGSVVAGLAIALGLPSVAAAAVGLLVKGEVFFGILKGTR